jgi:aspartate-semialdehyde dehydrogenase
MTRIALFGTSTLLGEELKEGLSRRRDLWNDLRLLTFEPESMGKVADLDGAAALVSTIGPETLEGVDLVIVPGETAAGRDLAQEVPGDATVLVVAPDFPVAEGTPLVADVNLASGELLDGSLDSRFLVSPHPAVIGLSLLLSPLVELDLRHASGLLMQPSSIKGQEGLDELLEQSRRILNFQPDPPMDVWGHQLAYNLLPAPRPVTGLECDLSRVLGAEVPAAIHVAQASVFHGCTLALQVELGKKVEIGDLTATLAGAPHLTPTEERSLGPIDAAGRDDIQVAVHGEAGSYWLWAVFDNLTRGGAVNAIAIVEALSKSQPN